MEELDTFKKKKIYIVVPDLYSWPKEGGCTRRNNFCGAVTTSSPGRFFLQIGRAQSVCEGKKPWERGWYSEYRQVNIDLTSRIF